MVLELKIKNKKEVIDMASTNKTSLGLNMWEASDKPVRMDFVNDNSIIDEEVSNLKEDLGKSNALVDEKISKLNSSFDLIKSVPGLYGNYGSLVLNSQNPSGSEGSEIVFKGLGGNTGDNTVLDCLNNIFRIFGNLGGTNLCVYEFRSDGIYLNNKKITN